MPPKSPGATARKPKPDHIDAERAPIEELFARNRGVWKLGPRAELETHAAFAYTGDREVKFVAEIYGFERFGDRRAIIGRVLAPDEPLSRRWVGRPAEGRYQNPVHYVSDV